MTVDYRKRVIVPMISKQSGVVEFDLVLYGVSYSEALVVGCPAIHDLAERYPNHISSPFSLEEIKDAQTDRGAELDNQIRLRQQRQRYS